MMSNSDNFVVIFIPEPQPGFSVLELRLNIKRLLNLDDEKLDTLFIGKPKVVKAGADEDTAALYKRAIERSGGTCWIEHEQNNQSALMSA